MVPEHSVQISIDDRGRLTLRAYLPIPPSDNKLYFTGQYGKRVLTTEGRRYKRKVAGLVATAAASARRDFRQNIPYEVRLTVYLVRVQYKTWNKRRYIKTDVGNRQKLIIDALTEAIGVDDSHVFKEVLTKKEGDPMVTVLLREMEE